MMFPKKERKISVPDVKNNDTDQPHVGRRSSVVGRRRRRRLFVHCMMGLPKKREKQNKTQNHPQNHFYLGYHFPNVSQQKAVPPMGVVFASSACTAFLHSNAPLSPAEEEEERSSQNPPLRRENERARAKVVVVVVVVMFLARGGSVAKRRSSRDAVVSVARAVRFSF